MGRILPLLYGLAAYAVFLGAFLYAVCFVADGIVPKTIDRGDIGSGLQALAIDILLLSFFAVQHSGMARRPFKRWLSRFVPVFIERSTYVLLASLVLILVFWQWRPIPVVVFQARAPEVSWLLRGLSLSGWFIVLLSTFLINHFELFGLHQVFANLAARTLEAPRFRTPFLYKFVRHPIYLGFIIAFWATPLMTIGHLLFACATTAYIFIGIFLEERDLITLYGNNYQQYRNQVGKLIPIRRRSN
jgi:protein-S-isoprenylcysteine O-methyltransferase Ste14